MKRAGNLMRQICDIDNLYLAFYKASKGKLCNPAAIDYRNNLHENISCLQDQLLNGIIDVGNYHYFTIYDPKVRSICAANFPERVLHHAIMNVCHDYFERQLIFDSYATRPEKGTHLAIKKAKSAIKNYQFVANFYLSTFDHYIKEELKVKVYIRYMDDMLLFSNSKEELKRNMSLIHKQANNLKLSLKPVIINKTQHGTSFLGYKLFPHKTLLNRRSKLRFKTKARQYQRNLEESIWNEKTYQQHIIPLLSFVHNAYTKRLKNETKH